MLKLQFTATPAGNCLATVNGEIVATCPVPAGASDDYGYMTMKRKILIALDAMGFSADALSFWYDGQEQHLAPDAAAPCDVSLDIDWEALGEALRETY